MNLKVKVKEEIISQLNITSYQYAIPFDLEQNQFVEGYLIADMQTLYIVINGKLKTTYSIKDYEHIYVSSTATGGYLYGKKGNKEYLIIEFSKHCYEKVAAVALGLDLYLQENFLAKNEMPERHCPKCGTPYAEGSQYCSYCGKPKGIFKTFLPYLFHYKGLIIVELLIILATIFAETYRPTVFQKIVDDFLKAGIFNQGFIVMIIILISLYVFTSLSNILRGIIEPTISYGMIHNLRVKVYDKVQHLSLSSANKKTTGGLITRISNDISNIANILSNYFVYLIYYVIELVALLVIMFIENWLLALLVIIPIPLITFLTKKLWSLISSKYHKRWKYISGANNVLHDILSGMKVVKTYGMEEKEVKRFKEANYQLKNVDCYTEQFWSTFTPIINLLFGFSQIVIYLFIGSQILNDFSMGLGDMIKWASYSGMLFGCANQIASFSRRYNELAISAEKIADILQEETFEEKGKNIQSTLKGEVIFDDVRFGYISFTPVLKELSFKIHPGETIGIVGYSGSGKTTLVNLLMKLYEPSHGKIYVDGEDISMVDSFEYRKRLGVVLQETLLFSGTIMENIMYGNDQATYEDVIRVSKMAKAHDFIIKKEFGYDTKLGKQGEGLSGGEKQRIAIARALLSNPSIFIFDEATSSLDTVTEKEIQEAISEVSSNKTTFIIAHHLSTLKNANRLIVLQNGKMVEFGSHEELIAKKGYYYQLVEAQYMNYEKHAH